MDVQGGLLCLVAFFYPSRWLLTTSSAGIREVAASVHPFSSCAAEFGISWCDPRLPNACRSQPFRRGVPFTAAGRNWGTKSVFVSGTAAGDVCSIFVTGGISGMRDWAWVAGWRPRAEEVGEHGLEKWFVVSVIWMSCSWLLRQEAPLCRAGPECPAKLNHQWTLLPLSCSLQIWSCYYFFSPPCLVGFLKLVSSKMKNVGYMSLWNLWSCSIVQYSSFLLMKFGREVHLLCHFMSQSSPKWLFLCQELRRRKGRNETGKKLYRNSFGKCGEEVFKRFFLHLVICYYHESSLPVALF